MKKLALLLLCAIMTLSFVACSTNQEPEVSSTPTIPETPASAFEYYVDGDYIMIDKYLGNDEHVNIPNEIENCQVVSTYVGAFRENDLKSVIIPDSLVSIGANTFANCKNLTSVTFGNGITEIQAGAFKGCIALKNIILPKSLKKLDNGTFENCTSLETVHIPSSVTTLDTSCFANNTALLSITLEDGVKEIGDMAFYAATSLETLTIPASVDEIGYGAFSECSSLKSITFLGNAPTIKGTEPFGEPNSNLIIYYDANSAGWDISPLKELYTLIAT